MGRPVGQTIGVGERLFDGFTPLNREPLGARANELLHQCALPREALAGRL
jgi:hypothetical protein